MTLRTSSALLVALLSLGLVACADEGSDTPSSSSSGDDIIGGSVAFAFPEAVQIDLTRPEGQFVCSGTVVAPRVVLTAGHCIDGATSWQVRAPNAGGQTATSSQAITNYVGVVPGKINVNSLDVGVLVLDGRINLSSYPTVASSPVPTGTQVRNVGRRLNGQDALGQMFVSPSPFPVQDGTPLGFSLSYLAEFSVASLGIGSAEEGDSGGPAFLEGSRQIIAVTSGGGTDAQGIRVNLLGRVDLFADTIQQVIAQNP
jgi:V8-like Glu-specific endopeptidase